MVKNNALIFGKNTTERVVAIEVANGMMEIFTETPEGVISIETRPTKHWFLTEKKVSAKQTYLTGGLHYQWMAEFDLKEDYMKARNATQYGKRDFWCAWDDKEQALIKNGITYFKGMLLNQISVLSFDIETTGLKRDGKSNVLAITNVYRNAFGRRIEKHFFLDDYGQDTRRMIQEWCQWVREVNPSVLLGHNILGYDLPYLEHVANMHGDSLELGRDNSAIRFNTHPSTKRKDGSQGYEYFNAHIYGREIIDTMFMAINYDAAKKKYESFALKQIIRQEGLEKPGRTFVDAAKIGYYYYNDPVMWANVKEYAKEDADDSLKLFDLMAPAYFYFSQSIPKTFQQINNSATGAQINSFLVRSYLQDGHSIPKADELTEWVEGGVSFGVPGIYKNVLKADLKSAYPSQVLRFKLYDKSKDPKAYFYEMVKYFTEERFYFKEQFLKTGDKNFDDRSEASKIFINSAYGLCNAPGLNFNSQLVAKKITLETRKMIDWSLTWASGKDTDFWMTEFKRRIGKEEVEEEASV